MKKTRKNIRDVLGKFVKKKLFANANPNKLRRPKTAKPVRQRRILGIKSKKCTVGKTVQVTEEFLPAVLGRPSKLDKKLSPADLAVRLAQTGHTEQQIANILEINLSTLTRWKEKYPDFCTSIKNAKENTIATLVGSLFNRAAGMKLTRVTTKKLVYKVKIAGTELPVPAEEITTVIEEIPPDTAALCFAITNLTRNSNTLSWQHRQLTDSSHTFKPSWQAVMDDLEGKEPEPKLKKKPSKNKTK